MNRLRQFLILLPFLMLLACNIPSLAVNSERQESLQAILDSHIDPQGPGVVVMIDSPTLGQISATRGMANIEAGTPVSASDRFRIASVTKTFVAVLVLQLVDEGILSLDGPARDWLPSDVVANTTNAESSTIRQLMNMTSGIPDYLGTDAFWEAAYDDPTHRWTAAELLQFGYSEHAVLAPGEGYDYSNSNYLLLQLILERATGESLETLVDERIAQPLGFADTYMEHARALGATARGYERSDGEWTDITNFNDGYGVGDGGIVTTAADLVRFTRALHGGELISDERFAQMQEWIDDGEEGLYGLGLSAYDYDAGRIIGHSGTSSGFGTELYYLTDYDAVIVIWFGSMDLQSDYIEALLDEVLHFVAEQ